MSHKLEIITDARCIVGEGPIFDKCNNRLLSVDIQGKRLRSIDWSTLKVKDIITPQETGFLFLDEQGGLYGGCENGIYRIDEKGDFELFSKPFKMKGERFNDGKIGPDGCLYAGTFSRDFSAAFYKMTPKGEIFELFDGVGNSNGLDWSEDKKELFYVDTPTKKIVSFKFDSGQLSSKKDVFVFDKGVPDGMTIDTDGNLWVAVWGGGMVLCINPKTKKIIDKIELPVSQVACCAFAGDDMKTLVITTAAHGVMLKNEPLAGATFATQLSVGGFEPNKLKVPF